MRINKMLLAFGLFLLFIGSVSSQKVKEDNKLMWRISSAKNEQDSYIYGTMHINDKRVFNFSDSVYMKINECRHFALEVHPDTLTKHLFINPFNEQINSSLAESEIEENEEVIEFKQKIQEDFDIDFSYLNKDKLDLLPLLKDKIFNREKDKNTFLDAHLYYIAKVLEKNIIGLETLENHLTALEQIRKGKKMDLPEIINYSNSRRKTLEDMIEVYEKGDVEELFAFGNYENDSILAHRNRLMVKEAEQFINDGGLFMAVGAAHLSGEEGMLNLFKQMGYTVTPVKAVFSRKMLMSELSEKKLDWIREENLDGQFSLLIPDNSYNYRPIALGGLMQMRSYPDLGNGHFYYYTILPVLVETYNLEMLEKELRGNLGPLFKDGNFKYSKYKGKRTLEFTYGMFNQNFHFRYIMHNNQLITMGLTTMINKKVDKKLLNKYFNSLEFIEVEGNSVQEFTSDKGAFKIVTNIKPQVYTLNDDSEGYKTISDYTSFLDAGNNLIHLIVSSYNEEGYFYSDVTNSYSYLESSFVGENDSLIYLKDNDLYKGKELYAVYDDNTFLKGIFFIRGNKHYQILSSGTNRPENIQKSDDFLKEFRLVDYKKSNTEVIAYDNFSSLFFRKPSIDTLSDFWFSSYETLSTDYVSLDVYSGANMWVKEIELNPYATSENIDSCFSKISESYRSYTDTIIHKETNYKADSLVMNFIIRNKGNQLDSRYKLIFDGNKIYELGLIQDSSYVDLELEKAFYSNFKLNKEPTKSILLRDSSTVKDLVKSDVIFNDSLIRKDASQYLNYFKFNESENKFIAKAYLEQLDLSNEVDYNENMINYLFTHARELFEGKILASYGQSDKIDNTIFNLYLDDLTDENIKVIKELVERKVPNITYNYKLTNLVQSDQATKLEEIIPELIKIGENSPEFDFSYLFKTMLEKDIMKYNQLGTLGDRIENKLKNLYQKKEAGIEMEWEESNDLIQYSLLTSYGDCDEELLGIYSSIFNDSSSYYRVEGAEALLRCKEDTDVSELYIEDLPYYSLIELFELKRKFSDIELLPDSLLNIEKYMEIATLAYVQEEVYFDTINIVFLEKEEFKGKEIYYYNCEFGYQGEDEQNKVVVISSIKKEDIKKNPFLIPEYNFIETWYEYYEEDKIKETKDKLKSYID